MLGMKKNRAKGKNPKNAYIFFVFSVD